MAGSPITQRVVVQNDKGLHIRPAEIVAKTAMQFESQISLEVEGHKIDAKSILHIMTLGARQGAEVTVEASGPDAPEAVERLVELIGGQLENDNHETVSRDQAG